MNQIEWIKKLLFLSKNKIEYHQPDLNSHMPALDGLRGFAILLVLLHHAGKLRPNAWFDYIFFQIAQMGWSGVDLFFVLSGFLITNILLNSRQSNHYFRNFYMRRTLRIFPLYYGVLVVFFLLLPRFVQMSYVDSYRWQTENQVFYWAYIINWKMALSADWANTAYFAHLWSLCIEEQFYLFWPLLVYFLGRRGLMTVFFVILPGAMILRFVLATTYGEWITPYVLTFARMDTLALGGMIALVARNKSAIVRLAHWVRSVSLVCVTALLVIILYVGELYPTHLLTQTFGLTLLAILFGALLVVLITSPENSRIVRFFSFNPLRTLGKYSYAIYVFHLPLRYLVAKIFIPSDIMTMMGSELLGQSLFFLVVSVTSFIAAVLSWHLLEKPFLKLKKFFPR